MALLSELVNVSQGSAVPVVPTGDIPVLLPCSSKTRSSCSTCPVCNEYRIPRHTAGGVSVLVRVGIGLTTTATSNVVGLVQLLASQRIV